MYGDDAGILEVSGEVFQPGWGCKLSIPAVVKSRDGTQGNDVFNHLKNEVTVNAIGVLSG